ncbi:MAG: hypothetical protein QXV54_05975 [Desulfurococcaceae archaeon]
MVSICAGLDLSGSEERYSGISIIHVMENTKIDVVFVGKMYTNEEITRTLMKHGVCIVAIDAPLTTPTTGKYFREVDLELIKMGYRVLPPSWASMKKLVERAIKLTKELRGLGISVIETHPTSSLKSSGCSSFEELLKKLNLEIPRKLSKDEVDAVISAIVCAFHVLNRDIVVKSKNGEVSLLPRICTD